MTMKSILTLVFSIFFFAPALFSQLPKGDRIIAWSVGPAENDDFDLAFSQAKVACMESYHLSLTWSSLEPDAGEFDAEIIGGILDVANIYFPVNDVELELQISVTNTVAKEVPADLMSVDFDDPVMISRFKTALDTIFSHIPDVTLSAVNIGNESDILFGVDSEKYSEFKVFLDEVAPYARTTYNDLYGTDIKIGTTLTLEGLTDPTRTEMCQDLNENLDIISTTYYPLDTDFTMLNPAVVEEDFDELVAIYPETERPIYFAECGYASSETCNSSELLQAQFYSEVFRVWDKHYDNIKYISIFKLTDWSDETIAIFEEYYGIDDPVFLEYLRTLGVRTWEGDGTDKLAYNYILCELEARDWCTVDCPLVGIETSTLKENPSVTLYPNPAQGQVTIQSDETISSIEIYNMVGSKILETQNNNVDLSNLSNGRYFVVVSTENGSTTHLPIQKL